MNLGRSSQFCLPEDLKGTDVTWNQFTRFHPRWKNGWKPHPFHLTVRLGVEAGGQANGGSDEASKQLPESVVRWTVWTSVRDHVPHKKLCRLTCCGELVTRFENLSTTTRMILKSWDSGKPVTKSKDIWDHGCLWMGSRCSRPSGRVPCSGHTQSKLQPTSSGWVCMFLCSKVTRGKGSMCLLWH